MFLVWVYFHKTHVSVSRPSLIPTPTPLSPLVSLSLPHYADEQPGAMAAEEVTCGTFSGVLLTVSLAPKLCGVTIGFSSVLVIE